MRFAGAALIIECSPPILGSIATLPPPSVGARPPICCRVTAIMARASQVGARSAFCFASRDTQRRRPPTSIEPARCTKRRRGRFRRPKFIGRSLVHTLDRLHRAASAPPIRTTTSQVTAPRPNCSDHRRLCARGSMQTASSSIRCGDGERRRRPTRQANTTRRRCQARSRRRRRRAPRRPPTRMFTTSQPHTTTISKPIKSWNLHILYIAEFLVCTIIIIRPIIIIIRTPTHSRRACRHRRHQPPRRRRRLCHRLIATAAKTATATTTRTSNLIDAAPRSPSVFSTSRASSRLSPLSREPRQQAAAARTRTTTTTIREPKLFRSTSKQWRFTAPFTV